MRKLPTHITNPTATVTSPAPGCSDTPTNRDHRGTAYSANFPTKGGGDALPNNPSSTPSAHRHRSIKCAAFLTTQLTWPTVTGKTYATPVRASHGRYLVDLWSVFRSAGRAGATPAMTLHRGYRVRAAPCVPATPRIPFQYNTETIKRGAGYLFGILLLALGAMTSGPGFAYAAPVAAMTSGAGSATNDDADTLTRIRNLQQQLQGQQDLLQNLQKRVTRQENANPTTPPMGGASSIGGSLTSRRRLIRQPFRACLFR